MPARMVIPAKTGLSAFFYMDGKILRAQLRGWHFISSPVELMKLATCSVCNTDKIVDFRETGIYSSQFPSCNNGFRGAGVVMEMPPKWGASA